MTVWIKQSSTQHALRFFLVQSADHITGLTGATPTVKLSKAGGTGAAPSGAVTEIDSTNLPGWYKVAANATDTNTLGAIDIHATATSADPCDVMDAAFIVPFDPTDTVRMGLTALPNATAGASNGLLISGTNSGTTTLGALTVTGSLTISDGLLVSRSSANSSAITATGNGTGSGIVATSGAGATGDGIQATAGSTNGNGFKLTKTGSGNDLAATSTTLSLAKTTNITGFNDIAATAIVSSGAITTSGGAVSTVTTVTNQLTAAQIATGVWQDTTAGDFTVALSVGKSLMNGVALGTGLTVNDLTTKTGFALTSAYDPAKTASQAGDVMKVSSGTGPNQINLSSGNLAGSVASVVGAVGSVTGNVGGSVGSISGITFPTNFSATLISAGGAITVGTLNAGVIDAASLATAAKTAISDNLLDRDMSTGTDTGTNLVRTVRQALRVLRNKVDTVGGTVYKEDDATSSWTFTVTTAAGNPIVLVDPT